MAGDDASVRELYEQLMDAWNRGDGSAFAAVFAEDGDLVAFDGTHFRGREQIAASHQELFDRWMKGTRLIGSVERLRFVSSDVAVMHALGNTIARRRSSPARQRASIQTLVAVRTSVGWRLAAFHNTRVRPIGRGALTFLAWTLSDRLWWALRLSTDPSPLPTRRLVSDERGGGRTETTTRFVGYPTDEIARPSRAACSTQIDKPAEHSAAKGAST
jgi:uncharacterized protein (TIGR02246 family)